MYRRESKNMRRKLKDIESKIQKAEKELQEAKQELATLKGTSKLPQPKIGDEIEIADMKWKVLDKTDKGFLCLAERIKDGMQFDSACNNWEKSALGKFINRRRCTLITKGVDGYNSYFCCWQPHSDAWQYC